MTTLSEPWQYIFSVWFPWWDLKSSLHLPILGKMRMYFLPPPPLPHLQNWDNTNLIFGQLPSHAFSLLANFASEQGQRDNHNDILEYRVYRFLNKWKNLSPKFSRALIICNDWLLFFASRLCTRYATLEKKRTQVIFFCSSETRHPGWES